MERHPRRPGQHRRSPASRRTTSRSTGRTAARWSSVPAPSFWSWGLSDEHDSSPYGAQIENADLQQFTSTCSPTWASSPASRMRSWSRRAWCAPPPRTTRSPPPRRSTTSPTRSPALSPVTITGTATDDDGNPLTVDGTVAVVEVSVDGGAHLAGRDDDRRLGDLDLQLDARREQGTYTILARAIDDSLNIRNDRRGHRDRDGHRPGRPTACSTASPRSARRSTNDGTPPSSSGCASPSTAPARSPQLKYWRVEPGRRRHRRARGPSLERGRHAARRPSPSPRPPAVRAGRRRRSSSPVSPGARGSSTSSPTGPPTTTSRPAASSTPTATSASTARQQRVLRPVRCRPRAAGRQRRRQRRLSATDRRPACRPLSYNAGELLGRPHLRPGRRRQQPAADASPRRRASPAPENRARRRDCHRRPTPTATSLTYCDRRRCRRGALRRSTPRPALLSFVHRAELRGAADANGNNVYQVTVSVSDGIAAAVTQAIRSR